MWLDGLDGLDGLDVAECGRMWLDGPGNYLRLVNDS